MRLAADLVLADRKSVASSRVKGLMDLKRVREPGPPECESAPQGLTWARVFTSTDLVRQITQTVKASPYRSTQG